MLSKLDAAGTLKKSRPTQARCQLSSTWSKATGSASSRAAKKRTGCFPNGDNALHLDTREPLRGRIEDGRASGRARADPRSLRRQASFDLLDPTFEVVQVAAELDGLLSQRSSIGTVAGGLRVQPRDRVLRPCLLRPTPSIRVRPSAWVSLRALSVG